jgi:hypothetical protein
MRRTVILDGEFSIYYDITIEKWKLQIACHNLQSRKISDHIGISKKQKPHLSQEMGSW